MCALGASRMLCMSLAPGTRSDIAKRKTVRVPVHVARSLSLTPISLLSWIEWGPPLNGVGLLVPSDAPPGSFFHVESKHVAFVVRDDFGFESPEVVALGGAGASRPATDGSIAIYPTGETDMPSDKQDSGFNPLWPTNRVSSSTTRRFGTSGKFLTWTDPRVAMQDVRVRTALLTYADAGSRPEVRVVPLGDDCRWRRCPCRQVGVRCVSSSFHCVG